MRVPAARGAVRRCFTVVVLNGVGARQSGSRGGESDGVQTPGGAYAHPPG